MPDLVPRRKVLEAKLNVFEGDVDRLRELINELNGSVTDGEGTYLEEDVFHFMVHLFGEHVKKSRKKTKPLRTTKKSSSTKKKAASKDQSANPSLDLGGDNAPPPPPFKLT